MPNFDVERIVTAIATNAEMVFAPTLNQRICSDQDDDKFLATALAGGARYLVTGDRALLKTSGFGGIHVMKPASFLNLLPKTG